MLVGATVPIVHVTDLPLDASLQVPENTMPFGRWSPQDRLGRPGRGPGGPRTVLGEAERR